MKNALRSAFIITLFSFTSQLVLFIAQILSAAFFGADTEMDAYLAAVTLPQYVISVLLGSLAFVFIPVFVDYKVRGAEQDAYAVAASLFNNCMAVLAVLAVIGIIFARPLIQLTAPGLSAETMDVSVKVAIITWPSILATGAVSLLSSIYQAEKKFGWQAAVPFIGAVVNVLLLLLLAKSLGVLGLAIAATVSVVVQALLLVRIIVNPTYRFSFDWRSPAVRQILRLLFPLIFVAVLTKFTPLIERYLASQLPEGTISHLNYAFKITGALTILITIGGSTVIFPKMAAVSSENDPGQLRKTISVGMRLMWLIIAPIVAIGFVLAEPVVKLLFERGEFTELDSVAVAEIFKIYSLALIGMCLGNITGRGFYVMKDTRTLAIFGTFEVIAYCIYTYFLTQWLGITGIVIGYVIYFNLSLLWQLIVLDVRLKGTRPAGDLRSIITTAAASCVGAIFTFQVKQLIAAETPWLIVPIAAAAGLIVYALGLLLFKSSEMQMVLEIFRKNKKADPGT
jgi:putative peptidoglycan lipid II flippase